jgi:class 3 adenylate cyclase
LYDLLSPYASAVAAIDIYVAYGSVHHALGLLATVKREFDDVELHFEEALRIEHTMGSRPLVAWTQYRYAEMLWVRGERRFDQYRRQLLDRALANGKALKMTALAEKARYLLNTSDAEYRHDSKMPAPSPGSETSFMPRAGTATVLFSDIENSIPLYERLGDAKAQEVMRCHYVAMRAVVNKYGGSEIKTTGDGFMVAFTNARQALLCAIDVQRALASSSGHGEMSLRVRIGIHTGEAISEAGDLFGKCVIIAARIMSLAKGAEILVSSITKDIIESANDDVRFDEGRALTLKGLSNTYTVFAVAW